MFFAGVENLYKMYEIPRDLQAKLLLPLFTKKALLVTNRLTLAELDDSEIVKQRILTIGIGAGGGGQGDRSHTFRIGDVGQV